MFVIKGNYHRDRGARGDEYVATDLKMKELDDQSYIVRSLDKADKFSTREDAESYLDKYNLRDKYWEIVEIN